MVSLETVDVDKVGPTAVHGLGCNSKSVQRSRRRYLAWNYISVKLGLGIISLSFPPIMFRLCWWNDVTLEEIRLLLGSTLSTLLELTQFHSPTRGTHRSSLMVIGPQLLGWRLCPSPKVDVYRKSKLGKKGVELA